MKNTLSTIEVARLMGVSRYSVNNWIKSRKLISYSTPGGHYRILKNDLQSFIEEFNFPPVESLESCLEKILIVDDDEHVLLTLKRIINLDFKNTFVQTANNGFDAGELIHTFKPDLVILDIGMEKIDGFQICEKIKANHLTGHIKIIIITGLLGEDLESKAYALGADSFITKPVRREKLLNEIDRIFNLKERQHLSIL